MKKCLHADCLRACQLIHHIHQSYRIRQIGHIGHLQRRPSCLVICIDLLVAGEVGKNVKIPTRLCTALFVIFTISPNSFLRAFSGMNGFISVKSCTVILEKKSDFRSKMIGGLCIITEGSEYTCHKTVQ